MLASLARCIGLGLLAISSGCAICSSCDDETYGAYGGRWERLDPHFGRVGSAFTPEVGHRVDAAEMILESETVEFLPGDSVLPEPRPAQPQPLEPGPLDGTPAPQLPDSLQPTEEPTADSSVLLRPQPKAR